MFVAIATVQKKMFGASLILDDYIISDVLHVGNAFPRVQKFFTVAVGSLESTTVLYPNIR